LWEGRQSESRLRAREFWWLRGEKYKLGRVVEIGGDEMV
jgi:hypothetical protein